ncbi:protein-glutamine gamma-glutamyltransferase 6-like [Rana temporaria]|uniref:protein-glutamine gamma-glutamyltransferase 6-like n=1 Tax=Rana temporaria TaxID=8407 RepID=UPI001AAC5798|nr:protein-glutamine gamma-glutamyltransferase 6-like [Rana temporaria]
MANMLYVKSVDLHAAKNKLNHRTNAYISKELIVRRGQDFQMTLSFNRALKTADKVTFEVKTGKSPKAANGTKATFSLTTKRVSKGKWRAVSDSKTSNTLIVRITPPVTAIIGSYQMNVRFFSGGYSTHELPGFILLFNPWAEDDDVYLADESERNEYILSDNTISYYGNFNSIYQRGWNLGQFEEDILSICLLILEKQKMVDISLFGDPKEVSRVCSAMVNTNDDNGVLWGKWGKKYDDGRSPTSWSGSVAILKQWAKSGPVKYGQCWVFAGVLCTVMRCLGIPSRIVTNFYSAHDTNEDLKIELKYDSDGNHLGGIDSIWNYHVWNEAWFTRPDIGSYYNGWQALDATPQEQSFGIYRLGPTSVKAIKAGDVHLKYDGPFVFAEVNGDEISWIYNKVKDKYELIDNETDTGAIGKFVSTKAVGSGNRIDITSSYKYAEGTAAERQAYNNALVKLFGRQNTSSREEEISGSTEESNEVVWMSRIRPVYTHDITGKFKEFETPELGQDIDLTLILSSGASSDKKITVNLNANITGYTRRVMTKLLMETASVSLSSNGAKEIPFKIPFSKYIQSLQDDKVVEVTALCKWDEKKELLVSQVITLKNPPLNIKVLGDAVINNPLSAEVTFTNPLNENLTDCEIFAEGSGLIKDQIQKKISLKPKEKKTVTIEFKPYTTGSKQLNIVVDCKNAITMEDFLIIVVKES